MYESNFVFSGLTTTVYAKWKPIPVDSITISPASEDTNKIYIARGGSIQLTASVTPANAFNTGVNWSESPANNTSGVSVDTTGKVTVTNAVAYDTTFVIMAVAKDGSGTTAKAYFVVKPSPEKMITVPTNGSTAITFPMGTNDNASPAGTIKHKFSMSETEVTYELWKKVYDWANKGSNTCQSNGQYCYTFANSGKEGSHGTAGDPPTTAKHEPVTNVNWRDTIVWSNAYTQWYNAVKGGSLTVVYYTENNYQTHLRTSTNGTVPNPLSSATAGSQDKPYIKASSNDNTDMASNTATGFRLPTSQEWEFAARLRKDSTNTVASNTPSGVNYPLSIGGTSYWFTKGNSASGATKDYDDASATGNVAWYTTNSSNKTHDVAIKTANALGIYDMSGNVLEWCFDHTGTGLVYRGGSWILNAFNLQVGHVGYDYPNAGNPLRGFRPVRTVP